jgi:predicted transcriptional regulator
VKKTSIYLDPELDRKLTRFAAAQGISKAEAIRRSIEREVSKTRRPRIRAIGVVEGPGDVSENDERYLLETDFGRD